MNDTCSRIDINLYSQILEKTLKFLGIPLNYSLIGSGDCGEAYLVNNKIFKITTDKSEAIESNKLLGKNNSYIANIYDVKKINNSLTNVNVYLIILEYLKTNRKNVIEEIEDRLDLLLYKKYKIDLFDLLSIYRFKFVEFKNKFKASIDKYLNPYQEEFHYFNSLLKIIDELRSNNINSIDLHFNNLGIKSNGNLAYFDLGFGDDKGKVDSIDVNERLMSYMPNSSVVKVKKKCQLGGNGDGTSTACNQGDINALELSNINESKNKKIEYGAVQLKINIKNWKEITDNIEKKDIYDKPTFGLETNPHITVLYGLHDDVKIKDIKEKISMIHNFNDPIEFELLNISYFETPNYDVVKFDVKSKELNKLNKKLKELPFTSDYPDYHPHMTISYVKKGTGEKYVKKFKKSFKLKSKELEYSTAENKRTNLK